MEVNGINFLGIVHSDAAHALRAQPCMVLKLKDVGKLPHSRVTTLGKTQWHPTSGSRSVNAQLKSSIYNVATFTMKNPKIVLQDSSIKRLTLSSKSKRKKKKLFVFNCL